MRWAMFICYCYFFLEMVYSLHSTAKHDQCIFTCWSIQVKGCWHAHLHFWKVSNTVCIIATVLSVCTCMYILSVCISVFYLLHLYVCFICLHQCVLSIAPVCLVCLHLCVCFACLYLCVLSVCNCVYVSVAWNLSIGRRECYQPNELCLSNKFRTLHINPYFKLLLQVLLF